MTSKELVNATLEFRNTSDRVPRQLWALPWADIHYPQEMKRLQEDFVWDFGGPAASFSDYPATSGSPAEVGEYVDEWGCTFVNITRGIIGEVKEPLVREDDWSDAEKVTIPEGWLSFDEEMVNRSCAESDQFLLAGCCPRPFEQLQFIRGTTELYMDLCSPPPKMLEFMERMHDLYCRVVTKWAQTDVDGIHFMDDWGSQRSLLINPVTWRKYFGPMYRDYIDIIHRHGKKALMHSDGYTLDILPDLIDMGLDAINTQIFCIGVDKLKDFRGKITFWGEIDRQNLLPYATTDEIDTAVRSVYNTLWTDGGCIAQCEFGAGANPANVYQVFQTWSELR